MLGNLAFCSGTVKICCWGTLGLTAFTIAEGIEDCSPTHHPTTILGHFRSSPLQFVIFGHTAHWCTLCQYPEKRRTIFCLKRGHQPSNIEKEWKIDGWRCLDVLFGHLQKTWHLCHEVRGKKTQLTFKHWLTSFRLSILPNRSTELLPRLLAADCVDMYRALFTSRTCCWSSWSFGAVWSMFTRLRPQQQEANNRRVHLCVGLANNRANWINTKTQYPKTTEHFNYSKRYWSKV